MTRFVYSITALLILAIGVLGSDLWENMLNMPDEELKEIMETGLFPVRQIRSHSCNCTSKMHLLDLGRQHHPRHLVTHPCEYASCTEGPSECQNLEYTVNVSVFRETDNYIDANVFGQRETCYRYLHNTPKTITVACIPAPSKRVSQPKRMRP